LLLIDGALIDEANRNRASGHCSSHFCAEVLLLKVFSVGQHERIGFGSSFVPLDGPQSRGSASGSCPAQPL